MNGKLLTRITLLFALAVTAFKLADPPKAEAMASPCVQGCYNAYRYCLSHGGGQKACQAEQRDCVIGCP